jgi:DHA1 family bicyclomycin/chloramphenicol resistance-like MFS transporter
MAANLINSRLVARFGGDRLLAAGSIIAAVAGLVVLVTARMDWGGLWGLAVPLFFFIASNGLIVANSISGALADHPTRSGAVSALIGASQYGSGMIGSALVGLFADGTPFPMSAVVTAAGIGCWLSVCVLMRHRPGPQGPD